MCENKIMFDIDMRKFLKQFIQGNVPLRAESSVNYFGKNWFPNFEQFDRLMSYLN